MLFRPILAILLDVYRCLHDAAPMDRVEITKAAQREIRIFADLCLLCTANLGAGVSDEVFCSDATPTGYAVHVGSAKDFPLGAAMGLCERWRFLPESKPAVAINEPASPAVWKPEYEPLVDTSHCLLWPQRPIDWRQLI